MSTSQGLAVPELEYVFLTERKKAVASFLTNIKVSYRQGHKPKLGYLGRVELSRLFLQKFMMCLYKAELIYVVIPHK